MDLLSALSYVAFHKKAQQVGASTIPFKYSFYAGSVSVP